jgi:predicted 3-demethylubiquinone-9 3-methyltransferase (glyoxalase superfamily)
MRQDQGAAGKSALGADVGWLTDKFGINWVVSIEKV